MSAIENPGTLIPASVWRRWPAHRLKHKARGEHETEGGARHTVDLAQVEALIENWPDAPKMGARQMIEHYGPPNEATPTKLFWYRNELWRRTELTSDVVVHNFPMGLAVAVVIADPSLGTRTAGTVRQWAVKSPA